MMVHRYARPLLLSLVASTLLWIAGCQPLTPVPVTPAPAATVVVEENRAAEETTGSEAAGSEAATASAASVTPAPESTGADIAPVSLTIPTLDLTIAVKPMGWEPIELEDGTRTTRWVVPEDAAGWAMNSAAAGAAGNTVLAGYQALGDAVFAAVSLGEVEIGQEIRLADAAGDDYVYRVTEVSDPIVLLGASEEEAAQAAAYLAPSLDARLTLVTGWPAATTTHRIFVVAELLGSQ